METDDKGQSVQDPDKGQSEPGQTLDDPNKQTQEPTDDNLPEKFKGKTAVEIANAHLELEKKLGEKDQEIKGLQVDLDDVVFEKRYSQRVNQSQQQVQDTYQPPNQVVSDEADPEEYIQVKDVDKHVDRRLQNVLGKTQEATQRISQSINYHEGVLEKAKRESPHIFKDVSNDEVKGQLFDTISRGQLNEGFLSNTNLYKDIARRVQDTKTNYGQNTQNVNQPASPVLTEQPVSTKPLEPEEEAKAIPQDDLTREMLKHRPKDMSEREILSKVSARRKQFGESKSE